MTLSTQNISHAQRETSWKEAKEALSQKIQNRKDLPYVSVARQLELLEELSQFELGRFLIETGGINGYWTHYVVEYKEHFATYPPLHPLEAFILKRAPVALATQERFLIFKEEIQKRIKEGCAFASIPCGVMGDLLDLDYSKIESFALCGIDLDPEALTHALTYAKEKGLVEHTQVFEKDAWNLKVEEKFDLIASSGLAMYEPNDEKVIDLYKEFYGALKPGGILVTSFLTPPPAPMMTTEWVVDKVHTQDALLQKIIFADILDSKWQSYRKEETVRLQLQKAGFSKFQVVYDRAHIFPVIIAEK